MKVIGGLALVLAASAISAAAEAASFDCAKAQSFSEKTICADPELSTADEQLTAAFTAALSRISKPGQDALRRDQRAWLGYRDQLCEPVAGAQTPNATPDSTPDPTAESPASCLGTEIDDRTKLLKSEGRHVGPYVLLTLGRYAVVRHKPDGSDPSDTGLNTQTAVWPQIDAPATPQAAAWNRWIEDALTPRDTKELTDDTVFREDQSFDPTRDMTLPAPGVISVAIEGSLDSGGAHPNGGVSTYTYLLDKERELQPDDLFDGRKPWAETLKKQSLALLRVQLGNELQTPEDQELTEIVSSPRNWTPTAQGLGIRFPTYSVAAYFVGEPQIVIPWRQMQDILAAKPLFVAR